MGDQIYEDTIMVDSQITEITRRKIIDHFASEGIDWSGNLADQEFLARLYDLTKLPSTDHRLKDAAADIRQHRESFLDWADDWVFFDPRFNLIRGPDQEFLTFLCEVVHPAIRLESTEARSLVEFFNKHLRLDGWELFEEGYISSQPLFRVRKCGQRAYMFDEPTGWEKVDRQIQEARSRLEAAQTEEQFQAVGLLCREVLISLVETVQEPYQQQLADGVVPSRTDAARQLQVFFDHKLRGGVNEEARAHAKAALKLTVALQHKRTAEFQMAALCAEAIASVVNIVAILSGRRR